MNTKTSTQIIVSSTLLILLAACASSPLGRKQLMLQSDGDMNKMGEQSFEELKKTTPIEKDAAINAYVRCVALPITRALTADQKSKVGVNDWEIVVFKDPTANAFALPGGKIGVHTGIIPVAKTDAQLAAVLGHEVGHVIARHGNERVSQGMLAQGGLVIADFLSGKASPQKKQLIMAAVGAGAQYGVLLPYGRTQESEADLIGLDLMSRAGFDPQQSVELWKNMNASGGSAPPEFMSTHPSGETRIRDLNSHMAENMPKYQAAKKAGLNPHCVPPLIK
jgi:predicted Zn-dependent protease